MPGNQQCGRGLVRPQKGRVDLCSFRSAFCRTNLKVLNLADALFRPNV